MRLDKAEDSEGKVQQCSLQSKAPPPILYFERRRRGGSKSNWWWWVYIILKSVSLILRRVHFELLLPTKTKRSSLSWWVGTTGDRGLYQTGTFVGFISPGQER